MASSDNHSCVALLPMKQHSARVPGKNFRDFAGKPLFRWMLDTLLSLDEIDLVVINTDARETLEGLGVLEEERVLLRDRKPELCGDLVSMNRILEDDINAVESEMYLMTHTTNPLIKRETVRSALQAYREGVAAGTADSLFSVNRIQTRFYREDGSAVNHDPDNLLRTQDLEPWFEENSCLYIFSRESFAETDARIGKRPVLFETPRLESADIDLLTDFQLAELVAKHLL